MARRIPSIDNEDAFRAWLREHHQHDERLVRDTIARCRRLNRDMGNIQDAYDADRCVRMLELLKYTIEDAHNHRQAPGMLSFRGDKRSDHYFNRTLKEGLATLRTELETYCKFREGVNAMKN